MLRRLHLLWFFVWSIAATQRQGSSTKNDPELENIEKMRELKARWSRIHPVIFPPLTEDAKKYLESYSKNKVAHEDSDFSTEINRNIGFIEGDIIPSAQDIADMEKKLHLEEEKFAMAGGERARRAAPVSHKKLWDKTEPIPFKIDPRYTESEKTQIRTILKKMTDNTCLTFKENGPGKPLEYFMEDEQKGCFSDLGDARDNVVVHKESQKIHLAKSCLTIRTIQHETMHALGFQHTHTRTDRDDYLQFDGKNIKKDEKINFDKLSMSESETNYGIPYEYSSIMHYPTLTDAQIDTTKPAMIPRDINYMKTVFGTYPIFNDWKMINAHYKCSDTCSTQIDCQNGGYQHPRLCTECVCPQFHSGVLCDEERHVVTLKMGETKSINHGFTLNETAYNSGYNYTTFDRSPAKLIKSPVGTRIRVTIEDVHDSERDRNHNIFCPELCDTKAVEIVDGDLTRVGKRFCCHPLQDSDVNSTFISETNVVGLVFFTRPGLDFTANVTFTVEEAPDSPQATNQTEQPLATTESSLTSIKTETPNTQTEEQSSTSTDQPEPEENGSTEDSQTSETNTQEPMTEETQTEENLQVEGSGVPETKYGDEEITTEKKE